MIDFLSIVFGIIIVYFCLVAFLYISMRFFYESFWRRKEIPSNENTRALVVIAHPDDEVMFFGPTVLGLLKNGPVFVLCLSQGNYESKGPQRKYELWNSCRTLGIPSENITLLKHDKLRDSPTLNWPIPHLVTIIYNHIQAYKIDTLITFDGHGVSGHPNHVAIYKAVVDLIERNKMPLSCRSYTLNSVSIWRKYVFGIFDVPFCYLFSQFMFVANGRTRGIITSAMECHKSQLVWFRRLYMIFSRYILVNSLREIPYKPQLENTSTEHVSNQLKKIKRHRAKVE